MENLDTKSQREKLTKILNSVDDALQSGNTEESKERLEKYPVSIQESHNNVLGMLEKTRGDIVDELTKLEN